MHKTPIIWPIFSIILTSLVVFKAVYKSKTLTKNGGLIALLFGISTLSNYPIVGVQLLSFFYLGKLVTKIGKSQKMKIEDDFQEKRDGYQVMANGFLPFAACAYYYFVHGSNQPVDRKLLIFTLSSFSACLGDTFSSELGILSKEKPRLITNLSRIVPRGTNGGVTKSGTLASILGGLCLSLLTWIFLDLIFRDNDEISINFGEILWIGSFSGFLGSVIDSLLGAVFEFSGQFRDGRIYVTVQNYNLLSGNQVNFLSGLLTSAICSYLF